jgi:hypothetical protein
MLRASDRFEQLPLVLSGFRYRLNRRDERVKAVLKLFEVRNKLLHVTHLWHYADVVEDDAGNILDIKYHTNDDSDPYREFMQEFLKKTNLRSYMKLYNEFIPAFASIATRIRRKNFNPRGWFVAAKP